MSNPIIFIEEIGNMEQQTMPIWVAARNCVKELIPTLSSEEKQRLSHAVTQANSDSAELTEDVRMGREIIYQVNNLMQQHQTFGVKLTSYQNTGRTLMQFDNEADMLAFILRWHP